MQESSADHREVLILKKLWLSQLRTAFAAPKAQIAPRTGTKDASLPFDPWGEGMLGMALAFKIIGLWVLLSCTLGPCLTWLFFYSKRQRRQVKDRRLPIGNPSSRRAVHSS